MKTDNLRWILLLSCIFFFALRPVAQIHIGFTFGYNNSTFSTSQEDNFIFTSVSSIHSFEGGITGDIKLYKNIFLDPHLLISTNGGNIAFSSAADAGSNTDIRATYIKVPINIGLKLPITKTLKFLISGGGYVAKGLYGNQKGWSETIAGSFPINNKIRFTNSNSYEVNTLNMRPFDFGYQFSTGIEWKRIQLNTKYAHGLKDVFPNDDGTHFRNSVFTTSIAYLFDFKVHNLLF